MSEKAQKKEYLEPFSGEVQEILSYIPNWMIRVGNTLILLVLVVLLLMSYLVKYPDTIDSEIMVTTVLPPEKILARTYGQLDAILVEDKDRITENQILAIIENTANYHDVLLLKEIIDTLQIDYKDFYFPLEKIPVLLLGEMEGDFAFFEKSYIQYLNQKEYSQGYFDVAEGKLAIEGAEKRLDVLFGQQHLAKNEVELRKKEVDRFEKLLEKGVIAAQEYDLKQVDYLRSERTFRDINASIAQLKEAVNSSRNSLKNSQLTKIREENLALKNTILAYNQLKGSLKDWELKYVLKSSISGKITFMDFRDLNRTVDVGDHLFTVIPNGSNDLVGKIRAPSKNSGKIKPGQVVNIKLDNYPHTEFGMLHGIVKDISLVPDQDGRYLVAVNFPSKLITSHGLEIPFRQEMRGNAEIITHDLRLLERLFSEIRKIFNSI